MQLHRQDRRRPVLVAKVRWRSRNCRGVISTKRAAERVRKIGLNAGHRSRARRISAMVWVGFCRMSDALKAPGAFYAAVDFMLGRARNHASSSSVVIKVALPTLRAFSRPAFSSM